MEERQVSFSLIPQSEFTPNEEDQKELEEMARKRNGIFYGKTEILENGLKVLKFVIEEKETGVVYEVDPKFVAFKK